MGDEMKNLNQQILNFDYEQNFKDHDFYVSKSNEYSFKLLNSWPKWEKNFVNLIGEKFSGKTHLSDIFSFSEGSINDSGDTLKVQVCVSDCPYIQNEPYLIDLIAADDACPLPQRDTVRVTIIVEPPSNSNPFYVNQKDTTIVTVPWNSSFSTLINGKDIDLDSLTLNYFTVPSSPKINLEDYGISFNTIEDALSLIHI